MSNFEFLKNIDKNLYEIALGAEKLYRDEYFEQCITQTRRLAENLCKNVLKDRASDSDSFDEMLATLKDKSNGSEREKEFVDDLYYLKKAGNRSVHSLKVKQDAIEALECLQRAFEASVNFALSIDKTNKKLLSVRFDEELLVLGVKKEQTLKEKYLEQKARDMRGKNVKEDFSKDYKSKQKQTKQTKTVSTKQKSKPKTKPKSKPKSKPKKNKKRTQKIGLFKKIILIMAALGIILGIFLVMQ